MSNRQRGAIPLYVINETDSELRVVLHYLTCEQVGSEQQGIGVEPNSYSYSANNVVEDSGVCTLEVSIPDRPPETYEWNVDRKTLVIRIKPDSIEFEHRSPTFTPGE